MLNAVTKVSVSKASLTGVRALVILGLLMEAPRSLLELREALIKLDIMEQNSSNDIIRIDLNTLKVMGCDISRACAKNDYKYILNNYPFNLDITDKEIRLLKRIYKILKDKVSFLELLTFDQLFKNIAKFVKNTEQKEALLGISILKNLEIKRLQSYIDDCKQHNTLTIMYYHPITKKNTPIKILATDLKMNNDKVYLCGYNYDKKEVSMLPIHRIKCVISRTNEENKAQAVNPIEVKFNLKYFNAAGMVDGEKIIETKQDESYIIKGTYPNEFFAVQRMLAFGDSCTVLEPENIRQKVIEKLLAMREIYKNG